MSINVKAKDKIFQFTKIKEMTIEILKIELDITVSNEQIADVPISTLSKARDIIFEELFFVNWL